MTLHEKFEYPITIPAGGQISTVGEALNFYFSLPMQERIECRWTETAKLLLLALEENGDSYLNRAESQFRFALNRQVPSKTVVRAA